METGTSTFELLSDRKADGRREVVACIVPAASYFDGHFPGYPVLPGIAQLAILSRILEVCGEGSLTIRAIPILRLLRTIQPDLPLVITLSIEAFRVDCLIEQRGESVTRGTLVLTSEEP